ncbi:MAG: magnesium-translocating P-type ATPase [Methanomassiliicoccales archaeon]
MRASKQTDVKRVEPLDLLALPIDDALRTLDTSFNGLSGEEAEKRFEIVKSNAIQITKRRHVVIKFLSYFRNPLVIILLIAGLISGFLGDAVEAAIIFVIVLVSVSLSFYQENKAEGAAEALRLRVSTTASVLRDGKKVEVRLEQVVPGDIVILSPGDIVPADSRILSAKDFFVDQSALTGESFPVEKDIKPIGKEDKQPTSWNNCVFLGTSVISGSATAAVMNTGMSTEYGAIAKKLVSRDVETDYNRGLRRFGYLITEVTIFLVIFVFMVNALNHKDVLQSLLFAVALAVGLTPELLPMIVTVNLSKGAQKMSSKSVIVKRLSSIQELGSMDVLCTDKTGTLTENHIDLTVHIDPEGNDDREVLEKAYLNSLFETGLKSPLDDAILNHEKMDMSAWRKIDEIPFDFQRRMASIVAEKDDRPMMILKGAVEEVLKQCTSTRNKGGVSPLEGERRDAVLAKYQELSAQGYRVLAVAEKDVEQGVVAFTTADEAQLTLVGFVAFLDPPKESALEALHLMDEAGIKVKIVTGNNELVTKKVCEQLGYKIDRLVLSSEMDKLDNLAFARVVEEANVFARVTPAQKDRIITTLKGNGHVVGFLGDGINDAPSLKVSDVGISVDTAVDVAKEAADIILLQKDLKVLHDGVLEGRKTFGNTMKYTMMGTSSNFGNMFSVAGASLFLPFLPMLPIQILLNNLLYDFSELTIPTDNVDPEYIQEPKKWDTQFIRRFMLIFGPISSIFDFVTFFILLFVFNADASVFQTAWFVESLSTQALIIFVIRTRRIPFFRSRPSGPLVASTLVVVLIAFVLPYTILGPLFQFVQLPLTFYLAVLGIIAAYLLLVEVVKVAFYYQPKTSRKQTVR